MFKKLSVFIKFLVIIGVVGLFAWGGYCTSAARKSSGLETEVGKKVGLKSKVTLVRITDKNAEGEVLKLFAKEGMVSDRFMELEEIKAVFYSKNFEPINIAAEKGVLEKATENAIFKGGVRVESDRPFIMETESLAWDSTKRILFSEEDVKYQSEEAVISGTGMIIDINTRDIKILSAVDARFN